MFAHRVGHGPKLEDLKGPPAHPWAGLPKEHRAAQVPADKHSDDSLDGEDTIHGSCNHHVERPLATARRTDLGNASLESCQRRLQTIGDPLDVAVAEADTAR